MKSQKINHSKFLFFIPFLKYSSLRLNFSIFILVQLIFSPQLSKAQSTDNQPVNPPGIKELNGFSQTIYYSEGSEDRAKTIAELMERVGQYFQEKVEFTPKTNLFILAPRHWKAIAAPPLQEVYGFPHNIDQTRLAIAAEDNDFWRSYIPQVDQLPKYMALRVEKAYKKPDGTYTMMPFFDLLAIHEMGHSYTSQAGLKMHRHWLSELFVNIMLHTYIAEIQPELLPALETFPDLVISRGTSQFKYTTLASFEELYSNLGMGPQNYAWYQCRLHQAAKTIYNAGGEDVIINLWKALKTHQEVLTDEALVSILKNEVHESVAKVFLEWDK